MNSYWELPFESFPGTSHREEILGQTQLTLEGLNPFLPKNTIGIQQKELEGVTMETEFWVSLAPGPSASATQSEMNERQRLNQSELT